MSPSLPSDRPAKPRDFFTRQEIRELTQASDLRGWLDVLGDWAQIAAIFALVAIWPSVLTVVLAVILLGARQLALAILTHEAAHRSLFRTRWLNDVVGGWLCAAPVWLDVARYRRHHLDHHVHTGLEEDPDLGLVEPYPTTRAGLRRKLLRDAAGITGVKRVLGQLAIDFGFLSYTVSTGAEPLPRRSVGGHLASGVRHLGPVVLANGALLGLLALAGQPWLYLLWVGAYLTSYSVVLRVRAIAEHACTEGGPDMLRNTRTTHPEWWAGVLFAPHHVNYHLEHHLVMTVPHWRLPAVHARLRERGALTAENVAEGYVEVLRRAASA